MFRLFRCVLVWRVSSYRVSKSARLPVGVFLRVCPPGQPAVMCIFWGDVPSASVAWEDPKQVCLQELHVSAVCAAYFV